MSTPVRPSSFAQDEIEYYLRRYESEAPGLGERLWQEQDEVLQIVALAHTSRKPNYWRMRLKT